MSLPSDSEVAPLVRRAALALRRDLASLVERASAGDLTETDYPAVQAALDACLHQLAATGIWGPDNRLPSSELWNIAGEILCRGWLQNQARTKPRGYAGDYEMLARIYENRRCIDPLGRLFDRYFQEQAAPQAVRNRMGMISEWIHQQVLAADKPQRLAIVGSAFGLELRDALASIPSSERQKITATLLDLDPLALEYARAKLEPLFPAERLITAAENLFRLPDRPKMAARMAETDLLFCPGLFDYLDDATASAMLAVFWRQLAPGGRLWVFQFAPHNPTRAYMEWLGNWYLIYRAAEELQNLAIAAGIPPSSFQIGAEPLGVDLFLTVSRD